MFSRFSSVALQFQVIIVTASLGLSNKIIDSKLIVFFTNRSIKVFELETMEIYKELAFS